MPTKRKRSGDRLPVPVEVEVIERRISMARGYKVMLDSDLAELYQVETRVLVQAIKRNLNRFPADFMFRLSKEETEALRVHGAWRVDARLGAEERTRGQDGNLHRASFCEAARGAVHE